MTTTRYYVTITWDDWPQGGSYGTIIEAESHNQAENLAKWEMANSRCEETADGEPDSYPSYYMENYGDDWHVVDCFAIDDWIARNGAIAPGER